MKCCFYVGYTPPFNGINFKEQQVFGSETSVIYLAEEYAKDTENEVIVFVHNIRETNMELKHNNVNYIDSQDIRNTTNIDKMIVSRYVHFFIMYKVIAKETILWLHDSVPNYMYDGKQIDNIGIDFVHNLCKFKIIDKIVFVSEYQKQNTLKHCKKFHNSTHLLRQRERERGERERRERGESAEHRGVSRACDR